MYSIKFSISKNLFKKKNHLPIDKVAPDIVDRLPSRNSMIAFSVRESAKANNQNSLVRPHPSCSSTRIASSSSLQTVRRWCRVFRFKCRKRSQSAHSDWHVSHWIIAVVTPSSWFAHSGRDSDSLDHCPEDSLHGWRWSIFSLVSSNGMIIPVSWGKW